MAADLCGDRQPTRVVADAADHDTARLTDAERALFEDLRLDNLGPRVRLEQERIGFGWIECALGRL